MVSLLRILKIGVLCLVALPASVGAHMGINQLTGNFHEVLPGELYRSAQPSGADVEKYAQQFGIKTIINLRDEDRGDWYRDEKNAAEANNIQLIDFPLSSSKEVPQDRAEELARVMKNAPKPVLIHCEHGANRTGLASAIYVGAVAHKSEQAAEFQLSPYYGHVPIKGVGRYEMYQSWDDFEETLGF
ncbi:dual specificity protein phosphatase family protein [Agrobacterium rubi]|uniref:dual specificity protein phosphatase family protein n=1 Tax=Agrobacterium rubi TaxID=28099 RepID=UPI0015717D72|nr:dual specificity protein phosphatase family protein [Agrobacterium rubi]NTF07960.1 dual specificity protein phosphatase family protein [Agrobacterium rubi]NTF20204.1 dual specificity protein phosphatase family protein [Agrobacterium rubi]NTF27175.1 dual specificity protein phosphatase family protein [Agrobacterium rubi]